VIVSKNKEEREVQAPTAADDLFQKHIINNLDELYTIII
jgi:hypothetical protein